MGSHLSTCAPNGGEYYHCDYSIAGFRDNTSTVADGIPGFTSVALQEELQYLEPNPDVAGIGTVVGFGISFIASTLLAIIIHSFECHEIFGQGRKSDHEKHSAKHWWHIADTILISWSDQQLVLGMATSIAALKTWCSFSTYHLNLIGQWLVLCSVTHANALLVHCKYFHGKRLLADGLRVITILTNLILSGMVFFVSRSVGGKGMPSVADHTPLQILPAQCFFKNAILSPGLKLVDGYDQYSHPNGQALFLMSLLILIGAGLSMAAHRWRGKGARKSRWSWVFRTVMLLANIGVGFASLVSSVELRNWMHENGWMEDTSELEWSYGQFIPALLGLLVVVSLLENVFDELPDRKSMDQQSLLQLGRDQQFEMDMRRLSAESKIDFKTSKLPQTMLSPLDPRPFDPNEGRKW
ncbi:hypothetical protein QBC32DRAFT_22879 [Pseudoneurospora amorphoporcata]|uniref:Uncharacterized protein n=1 Tax=Pseudoneurospora amorphoporcata TaxID=241081 RepID=A0AAN6P3D5_9PEZI|nr:hypothetical protein QBC32DRAFT_22879 [Pseudoneurospora amorphoporcata]